MIRRAMRPLLAACLLVAPACEKTGAFGEANSIIVGATNETWSEIGTTVEEGLQPTIFTVRDEKTFRITQQDPHAADWDLLREFKQVLLVGSETDEWVAEALAARRSETPLAPPQILQVFDVWARGQLVTVLLLNPGGGLAEVQAKLPELHELLDNQYRQFVLARMFVSGRDSALVDTLRSAAGFSLDLPKVYRWTRIDSVYLFRNDNPDPAELIRQVAITWRSPIPEGMDQNGILEWRQMLVDGYYADEQIVVDEVAGGPGTMGGMMAYQVQGVWQNPPGGWPAGGPFLTRTLVCPEQDRLYLLDAWLYAPGKDKYEYMLQLQTILNSFRCYAPSTS